jgi:AcrR family transcriptional regulator
MSHSTPETVARSVSHVQRRFIPDRGLLDQQLANGGGAGEAKLACFVEARRRFLRGQRLDMLELARDLGIGRATLYRWFKNREWLLGEVLWSLGRLAIMAAESQTRATGTERVLAIYSAFLEQTVAHGPLRAFVEADPELALRAMTTQASPLQSRLVAENRRLLAEAFAESGATPRLPLDDLAYVMVRIGESFSWREFITGEQPDVSKAVEVVRVLLG